jgi:hypothetical protein
MTTDAEELARLERELAEVEAERNRQYWAFTRTARSGKPVTREIHQRKRALEQRIAALRKKLR